MLMRIAVANWNLRKLGGIESYLDEAVGGLSRQGHEIAFLCESDVPTDRAHISLPTGSPVWCAASVGRQRALDGLTAWAPDIIYVHRIMDYELEASAIVLAPAVFFAHDYQRTCLSGSKTFSRPAIRPCSRPFGWPCLALYIPRQCGKSGPAAIWKAFGVKSRQLELLRRYSAVITHSQHMRTEYLRQGFGAEFVHQIPFHLDHVDPPSFERADNAREAGEGVATPSKSPARLLFAGRMERLKGGQILLDALPAIAAGLRRSIEISFAGEGSSRPRWQAQAERVEAANSNIRIRFHDWLDQSQLEALEDKCDLLVVPSLWPEPFGRVGGEAGLRHLPVAAFAVGGIPEWLIDGVNGYLAPADPPTAAKLAKAVVKCLRDSGTHSRLREGAFAIAKQLALDEHVGQLSALFANICATQAARRAR
jgi:glycosyltransferase involved in cell wall biosynthesis